MLTNAITFIHFTVLLTNFTDGYLIDNFYI